LIDETNTAGPARCSRPPETDELETAVRDVAYRLTHDMSDTADDLRDAAAFAPLAVVKAMNNLATRAAAHPRKLALTALLLAGAAGLIAWRRSKRERPRSRPRD
jgi:hypothetical protein